MFCFAFSLIDKGHKNTNKKRQWEALCNYQVALYSTHQAWVVITEVVNICLYMQKSDKMWGDCRNCTFCFILLYQHGPISPNSPG